MPHARLKHPTRPVLEFRQGQRDQDTRQAVMAVTPETGTDKKPIVNVKARDRRRSIDGLVTGQRRAENNPAYSDWEQALATYVDRLQSTVDDFQGDGYTFEDDLRNLSLNCVATALEWRYRPREPYDLEFSFEVTIGNGTFEKRPVNLLGPTINNSLSAAIVVDGNDLTGTDTIEVEKRMETEVNPTYDSSSAEDNDVLITEGPVRTVTIRGMQTGTDAQRRSIDDTLDGLVGGSQVTLKTYFPGYNLDGYVREYETSDEAMRGGKSHRYKLTFVEGTPD